MSEIVFKYIGKGSHVVGIPAKDLTAKQVKKYGGEAFLLGIAPPLYKKVKAKTTIKTIESSEEG